MPPNILHYVGFLSSQEDFLTIQGNILLITLQGTVKAVTIYIDFVTS